MVTERSGYRLHEALLPVSRVTRMTLSPPDGLCEPACCCWCRYHYFISRLTHLRRPINRDINATNGISFLIFLG
jgi:hypothetical protein